MSSLDELNAVSSSSALAPVVAAQAAAISRVLTMLCQVPIDLFLPPCAYGAVLSLLLPPELDADVATAGYIAAVGLVAHTVGFLALRIAEFVSGANVHSEWCREWGAAAVFCVSLLQGAFSYNASFKATILLPTFLAANVQLLYAEVMLWAPLRKRPAGAVAGSEPSQAAPSNKRRRVPRALAPPGPGAHNPSVAAPAPACRYDASFWGLAWETRGAGPTFEQARAASSKPQFEFLRR